MTSVLPPEEIIGQVLDRGYSSIKGCFTSSFCETLKQECLNVLDGGGYNVASPENTNSFHGKGGNVSLIYNAHNKGPNLLSLIAHDRILEVVEPLLAKGSYRNQEKSILLSSTVRGLRGPGEKQQLHIDSNIPGLPVPLVVQVIIVLDAFDVSSGGTRLVPFSHRFDRFAKDEETRDDEIEIEAEAGDVIIFDGGLWHGSSQKTNKSERWIVVNTYGRWFLKPAFDFRNSITDDMKAILTNKQKDILGFRCMPPDDEFERVTRWKDTF